MPTIASYKKQYRANDAVGFFSLGFGQTASSLGIKPESSGSPTVPKLIFIPSPQCWMVVIMGKDNKIESKQHCEKETDIDDYIAELTSTDKGRKLWKTVSTEFENELWQKVISGEISKIKYYRITKNIDQKTLAKLTGLQQPNISRIEKPKVQPSIQNYKKIAKALNMDYKDLLA